MAESLATLLDLLTRPEFVAGFVVGLIALGLLFLTPAPTRGTAVDWGLLLAAGTMIAIHLTAGRRFGLAAGIGLLAIGGWAQSRSKTAISPLGWTLVGLGAVVVAWRGGFSGSMWFLSITALVIAITGWTLARWSVHLPSDLLGPLFAMSAFGIWATVPETEMARALLGTAIPMGVATLRPVEGRLTHPGAYALAGVVIWVVASGGEARPASIIGGWACMGVLLILPYCTPTGSDLIKQRPLVIILVHAAVVLVASRAIGLWESVIPATIAATFLAAVAYIFLGYLLKSDGEPSV